MTVGIITGGKNLFKKVSENTEPESNLGVFGKNPGATPKYAINRGPRGTNRAESMARLFLDLPENVVKPFVDSLPSESRPLGRVLATVGGTGGASGTGFVDFILTQATESFKEKAQIVSTLTDNYVAFYSGQEPPLFQYSGHVFNTYQDDQRVWLLKIYRDILRGTQLAKRNIVARLRYDSFIVSGYMENLNLSLRGSTETAGTFRFSIRVKEMRVITPALGYPTITETPITEGLLLNQEESEGPTERVAVASTEKPEDAAALPGADSDEDEEDPRLTGLVETGEIEMISTVDNNNEALQSMATGATAEKLRNELNVSDDGQGGLSNFKGIKTSDRPLDNKLKTKRAGISKDDLGPDTKDNISRRSLRALGTR